MKLALLGIDREAAELAKAAVDSGNHEVVVTFDADRSDSNLPWAVPSTLMGDDWESLLLGDRVDAVIVAEGQGERRDDQLRKLTQQAIPILVVHPVCEALLAYELDMIRRDTDAVIATYYPGSLHPAVLRLAQLASGESFTSPSTGAEIADIGRVEQLSIERGMSDRRGKNVQRQLARDTDTIRRIIGRIDQVSAFGSSLAEQSSANLSVQMSGPSEILSRWSVVPAGDAPQAKLVLIGSEGQATLLMPSEESQWSLEIQRGETRQTVTFQDWNGQAAALEMLSAAISGQPPQPTWTEVCNTMEAVDCVEHSLRRGRTITIHQQQHTEQETFKGMMAAGGCGALLLTLFALGGVAMVEAFRPPFRDAAWWRLWPVYLLTPITLFLLLQLFQLVFKQEENQASPPTANKSPKSGSVT